MKTKILGVGGVNYGRLPERAITKGKVMQIYIPVFPHRLKFLEIKSSPLQVLEGDTLTNVNVFYKV